MSGELQSIPARHGTATFVPKGQTIKIINTYGKQVVDTWIFGLYEAPDRGEDEEEAEAMKEAEEASGKTENVQEKEEKKESQDFEDQSEAGTVKAEGQDDESVATESNAEDPPQQKDQVGNGKRNAWSSYMPSSSYLPSLRRKQQSKSGEPSNSKAKSKDQKRTWASYFPSGVAYSSYLPNKSTLSGFASQHQRDPTKSYAEQLYDFSKTPVGAASLSVASGSGTASSLYAAYSAYTKLPRDNTIAPMEYLSLPHTRAATKHLTPELEDLLVSNLRSPLMTLVEDTSAGVHDAVHPACDAAYYSTYSMKNPEEHGSCAENLVLALKELNESAGLKGHRAIGADMTVNIAPTPLHLFMNTTVSSSGAVQISSSQGPKRSHVRLRAEKDVVVVMSACPDDQSGINGDRCMAANFVVEEASSDVKEKPSQGKKATVSAKAPTSSHTPSKPTLGARKSSQAQSQPQTPTPGAASAKRPSAQASSRRPSNPPRKLSQQVQGQVASKKSQGGLPSQNEAEKATKEANEQGRDGQQVQQADQATQPIRKKPKKLERRGTGTQKA